MNNYCNAVLLAGLSIFALCCGPGPRVGDGYDYYVMLISWAENGTPYSTDRVGAIFEDYLTTRPDWHGQKYYARGGVTEPGRTIDYAHFWLYSLLAAPFYWPLKGLRLDIGLSFNCLHVALLLGAAWLIHRRQGPAGVLSLILLVIASPLLWWINKAHTEFFTVVTATVATSYFLAGEYAWSAVWLALVAAQNPSFLPLALLALTFGFLRDRWKLVTGHKTAIVLFVAILALHPAYYLLRSGTATPLLASKTISFQGLLLPLKHMAAFWLDPDIGLLTNWPLALPWLLCFVVPALAGGAPGNRLKAALQNGRLASEPLCFLGLLVVCLTWSYTRLSPGFGGGGTVSVSRYAVWLLFVFFPIQWGVLRWLWTQRAWLVTTVLTLIVLLGAFTAWLYRPSLAEVSRRPTAVSHYLYAHLPSLYDPMPQIFYICYGGQREFNEDETCTWTSWAVSDPSGNKILINADALEHENPAAPRPVLGCPTLDPSAVYQRASERLRERPQARFFYLDGLGNDL